MNNGPQEELKLNIDPSEHEEGDGEEEEEEEETMAKKRSKMRVNRRHEPDDPSCVKQMFYCLVANQSFRQKRKRQALAKGNIINSVSKIDSISRVLFPVTFSVINVIYWWGFIAQNNDFTWKHLDHYKFY